MSMERIPGILRRFHRGENTKAPTADIVTRDSMQRSVFTTDLDHSVAPSPEAKPFDEIEERKETECLMTALRASEQEANKPVVLSSVHDQKRWYALDRTFQDDIRSIQLIQWEKLAEVDQYGAERWLEVASVHMLAIGCVVISDTPSVIPTPVSTLKSYLL